MIHPRLSIKLETPRPSKKNNKSKEKKMRKPIWTYGIWTTAVVSSMFNIEVITTMLKHRPSRQIVTAGYRFRKKAHKFARKRERQD